MEAPIRVAIFDIGDVLFTPHQQDALFASWAPGLGVTSAKLSSLLWYGPDIEAANVGVITAEEYCQRCAARLNLEEEIVSTLIEEIFSGKGLNHELIECIQDLKPRIKVVALTNNWSFGRRLIEQRGISELFDLIVTSAEEGVRKPDPRIYKLTLSRLGVIPEEAVFVDDDTKNVATSRALGIHSIQFRSTAQTISELNALLF